MPGSASRAARSRPRSAPVSSVSATAVHRPGDGKQRRSPGPRHRQRRRIDGGKPSAGEQQPRLAVERDRPVGRDDAAQHGAGAGHRDLLADDGPYRHLEAVDGAGRAQPGPLGDERRQRRVGAQQVVDRDRIGVQVEQPPHPGDDGHQVTLVGEPHPAGEGAVARRTRHQGRPARRGDGAGVHPADVRLDTRNRPRAEEVQRGGQVHRRAVGQPQRDRPRLDAATIRPRLARRPVGVVANTACIVSLNCRTLANPAAKATSVLARSVVSSSTRAVWARWARASAIGPAPTSASSVRLSCRSE